MAQNSPLATVQAWQEAVNNRNLGRLLALSATNIEIVGPRGSGYGHQLLSEWLERAWLSLQTLRAFQRGEAVVVAQHGVWSSVETREVAGEQDVASAFRVSDGCVTQFARYATLDEALQAAGLDYSDEVGG